MRRWWWVVFLSLALAGVLMVFLNKRGPEHGRADFLASCSRLGASAGYCACVLRESEKEGAIAFNSVEAVWPKDTPPEVIFDKIERIVDRCEATQPP